MSDPTAGLNKSVKDVDPKTDKNLRRRIGFFGSSRSSRLGRLGLILMVMLLIFLTARAVTDGGRTRKLVDSGIRQRNVAFCIQTRSQLTLDESTLTLYGFLLQTPTQANQTPQQIEENKQFKANLQDNVNKIQIAVNATLILRRQLACLPPDQPAPSVPRLPPLSD